MKTKRICYLYQILINLNKMGTVFNADGTYYQAENENYLTETLTASTTLTANDSGKTFNIATDALVVTLPSTALNLEYTFVNTGADGANIITISPAAADGINGTITLASTIVELSGVANKDLINTKSTATTGNTVKIKGNGIQGWDVLHSTGIWASE